MDELPDVCIVDALRLLVSFFAKRLQEHPMCDEGKIQELFGSFPVRAAIAAVTKAVKMCIARAFFQSQSSVFSH